MVFESEEKVAFTPQYNKLYAMNGRTRTLPLAWAQQANADDSLKT